MGLEQVDQRAVEYDVGKMTQRGGVIILSKNKTREKVGSES